MKNIPIICILFFFINQLIFPQPLSSITYHPFSNALVITVEAGGTIPRTDYKIDELDIASRLLLEYFFPSKSFQAFGIRLMGGGGFIKGNIFSNDLVYPPVPDNFRTGFLFLGGGFIYAVRFGSGIPYISTSVAYTAFNPLDENGYQLPNNEFSIYKKETLLYSVEAGLRFPFSEKWSLNLGFNINFSNSDYLDDIKVGNNNDAFISIFTGVSLYLGRDIDRDSDGVEDDIDLCPNTQVSAEVDEFGCQIMDVKPGIFVYDSLKDAFVSNAIFTDGLLFCFQVDIFKDLKDAESLQKQIISFDYNSNIFTMSIGNSVWHSVRVGYFTSYKEAQFQKENLFRQIRLKSK